MLSLINHLINQINLYLLLLMIIMIIILNFIYINYLKFQNRFMEINFKFHLIIIH